MWNGSRNLPAAMHRNVETLIGRLATDPKLRRRFAESPEATLRRLSERGLELSEVEIAALAATDPGALLAFAGSLDARLRRAPEARIHDTPDTQEQPELPEARNQEISR